MSDVISVEDIERLKEKLNEQKVPGPFYLFYYNSKGERVMKNTSTGKEEPY